MRAQPMPTSLYRSLTSKGEACPITHHRWLFFFFSSSPSYSVRLLKSEKLREKAGLAGKGLEKKAGKTKGEGESF